MPLPDEPIYANAMQHQTATASNGGAVIGPGGGAVMQNGLTNHGRF
jgi:hypothetical protein